MTALLDEEYLSWLYDQVVPDKGNPQYWHLFRQMYKTEFVWFVPNDDNRVEDGRELRLEFFNSEFAPPELPALWVDLGCSMLELFVGLARRLCFQAEGTTEQWFWELCRNVRLDLFNDRYCLRFPYEQGVDDILQCIIWRLYQPNGHGGLFPLNHARQDQRGVELWYQLSAYLLEKD